MEKCAKEKFWTGGVESLPEGDETKTFLRRMRSDDFVVGDSFWIQGFEFLVVSDIQGNELIIQKEKIIHKEN